MGAGGARDEAMEPVDGGLDAGRPGGLAPGRRGDARTCATRLPAHLTWDGVAGTAPTGPTTSQLGRGHRRPGCRGRRLHHHRLTTSPSTGCVHGGRGAARRQRELEVKNGASLLVNGTGSVWGPNTNVAINNAGSLGGTGTIRVQGGIFFASPNTGSVLTSGPAATATWSSRATHSWSTTASGSRRLPARRRGRRQPEPRRRTRGCRPSPAPPRRSAPGPRSSSPATAATTGARPTGQPLSR